MARLSSVLGCLIVVFSIHPTWAEEIPKAVNEAGAGIVRIRSILSSGTKKLEVRERTGFLVGEKGGEPYVITTSEGLTFSSDDQKRLIKSHKLEENVQLTEQIFMIFQGDVQITLAEVGSSDQKNLAILKPNQTLTDKYVLEFSEKEAEKDERVFLISFPSYAQEGENNYSKATAVISPATVLNTAAEKINSTRYFYHNVNGNGNIEIYGAPFVDEKGKVAGMIVDASTDGGDNRIALTSKEIISFMDLHKAAYSRAKGVVSVAKARSRLPLLLGGVVVILSVLTGVRLFQMKKNAPAAEKQRPGEKDVPSAKKSRLPEASVLRLATQETITINDDHFVIGSSSGRVNYVPVGNKKISRSHAVIRCEKGKFFLEDLHSTNGTTANGRRIEPGQKVKLEHGMEFALADERFVFWGK